MRTLAKWMLIAAGTAGVFAGVRAVIVKYGTILTVAIALWNDPQVQKARKHAVKKLRKAKKSIDKAARHG